jgi:hypothetical protein
VVNGPTVQATRPRPQSLVHLHSSCPELDLQQIGCFLLFQGYRYPHNPPPGGVCARGGGVEVEGPAGGRGVCA